jgi:hypothetical protein
MTHERLQTCLTRLIPHVDATRIAVTGSVAIGIHGSHARRKYPRAEAPEDVDFVAETLDAIRPSVAREFLISGIGISIPVWSDGGALRTGVQPGAGGGAARSGALGRALGEGGCCTGAWWVPGGRCAPRPAPQRSPGANQGPIGGRSG